MNYDLDSNRTMGTWLRNIFDNSASNDTNIEKNSKPSSFDSDLNSEENKFLQLLIDNNIQVFTYLPENMEIDDHEQKELLYQFNKEKIFYIINALSEKGYLHKEDLDPTIQCPNCYSKNLNIKYICTKCNTTNVRKYEIYEHPYCGYRDIKTNFISKGGLVCPQCNSILTRREKITETKDKKSKYPFLNTYRINGTYFECIGCSTKIEKPSIGFKCRDCGTEFNHIDGIYQIPYKYTIDETIFKKIKSRNKVELLIIEDNELQAEVLSMLLKDSESNKKYSIEIVNTGEEAIKLIEKRDFNCIIQDLGLPDIEGLKLLKKIKTLKPEVKVIVYTGYDDREIAVNAMKNGASEFLIKNDDEPESIIKKIESVINI